MFPFFPQPDLSFGTANVKMLLNVTKRYADGLHQLVELNTQTVKTVFEESASVFKAGSAATPGEFMSWQASLVAAFPEKAAAYTRHVLTIIRATESDILDETRAQFEQYGPGMKGVIDSAAQNSESMSKQATGLLSDAATASMDAASETAGAVVDASEQIAHASIDAGGEAAEGMQEATDSALRRAKATSKRGA